MARSSLGSIATGAANVLYDSMVDAVAIGHFSANQFEHAMRGLAASSLKSLGSQATVKGAKQLADGVADLADKHTGSAGGHFLAAGEYFAVAALAGAGSAAMDAKGGGPAQDSKDASVDPKGAGAASGGSGGGGGGVIQKITIVGEATPEKVGAARDAAAAHAQ